MLDLPLSGIFIPVIGVIKRFKSSKSLLCLVRAFIPARCVLVKRLPANIVSPPISKKYSSGFSHASDSSSSGPFLPGME